MASKMSGTPKMIVPYEWILENVGEEPVTMASKMILFRGERVFRVGLKNHAESAILFFVAINLSKIGLKVEDVTYQIQGSGTTGPVTMEQMKKENIGDGGSLQLLKTRLGKKIVGNCTFSFRIVLEGVIPCCSTYGYSYKLCDRLVKEQFWNAIKNQQNLADVEVIVKDKTFFVHKAILAARSRVFAVEFTKKQPGKDGNHQVRLDGVDPSTVAKFLYFVYTGEPMGMLADEELLKLASKYGLLALAGLCQVALKKIEPTQMAKLMESLDDGVEGPYSSKITPEKDAGIINDQTMPTLRCTLNFTRLDLGIPKCVMEYQKEKLFFAYITGYLGENRITKPGIHFTCANHRRFGLKVEDIYFVPKNNQIWFKLEAVKVKNNAELLQHFTVHFESINYSLLKSVDFNFDIKVVSTIGNYNYEMMDDAWPTDFWMAAANRKLTDVEIYAGTVKVMEAHRVILCARSPVLNASFNKISNSSKLIISFGAEFDVDTVKLFLNFLYTGSLKSTDGVHQLGKLATMYQVETLKNVCQLLNANPPDAEELTDYLLQL
ncbi:hypothetical protein DAPPUDRAFT_223609 [Daphnia pulex]|uniref:BTB domain-containing protein n=1 Tax=Daphnia pulex TaxID=6669 RepID=E9GCG8_DAPPU|nr:hypothetical protein DAPPUDRAFT_223609 [Daphnia pulex]|eukprot:EFX82558.1 hypothetical protein DAPPUDRAFT_223609 [Daphnia pulex]